MGHRLGRHRLMSFNARDDAVDAAIGNAGLAALYAALARDLGFSGGPTPNSMDAVADRDFAVETLAWAALTSRSKAHSPAAHAGRASVAAGAPSSATQNTCPGGSAAGGTRGPLQRCSSRSCEGGGGAA
jgi:hypothetical protein